jgi:hypothetical protein
LVPARTECPASQSFTLNRQGDYNHFMNKSPVHLTQFKVDQAIGSMAIEGLHLSAAEKGRMLQLANGKVTLPQVRQALLEKYRVQNQA